MQHTIPIIAIVGRPNVGKSSLFNRLMGRRIAIESDIAGTTRDRLYRHCEINGLTTVLVDTGGLEYGKKENIEADIKTQVMLAVEEADLIMFIADAKEGLTVSDYEAADMLRKSGKKMLFIANKTDSGEASSNLPEMSKLGFGEPIEISAYHREGIDTLLDEIEGALKKSGFHQQPHEETMSPITNICFLGKPNVGKSSLVNALLGKPKVIVSDIPGTTRDAIDTEITWNDKKFNIIDTAGLRRRGKIERGLEKLSTFRAIDAIERSDVTCLIIDFKEGVKKQDQHIASYILEAGKGLLIVVNKTDLMEDREEDESRMITTLRRKFEFLPWAPAIFVSALKRSNIEKILELSAQIHAERFLRLENDELQGFMKEIIYKHLPPHVGNRLPKFYSLEQGDVNPPTFVYWVNDPMAIHFSYKRYLENELRARWPFTGTCIKIVFQKKFRGTPH
jgi:GTP-binding protein